MKTKSQYIDAVMLKVATPIFVIGASVILIGIAVHISVLGKQNQTYNRFVSCVLSVPALDRNQAKIDKCYTEVEKETGVRIHHY